MTQHRPTSPLPPGPEPQLRSLPARLDAEWRTLAGRPVRWQRVAAWGLEVEYASLDDIVAATGFVPHEHRQLRGAGTTDADADVVLTRLLLAARVDDLAARVVLQRLLPGLCTRARRWESSYQGRWLDAFDDVLTAAWLVIRSFPVERRPRHLVANLLRDAEHQAFVKATRRRWRADAVDPTHLDLPVDTDAAAEPIVELAEVIAVGRARLSDHEMELLRLVIRGHSSAEVAVILGVSERTVRYHREAIVERLRAAIAA